MDNTQMTALPEYTDELKELIKKVDRAKPDKGDKAALVRWIEGHPDLFTDIWNLSQIVQNSIIEKFLTKEPLHTFFRSELDLIAKYLSVDGDSALERLLIQNILVAWLHLQWVEFQLVNLMGNVKTNRLSVEFWEKQATVIQHRYLRACESLARVRKLARYTPALQVNIATERGQQVNIAGEVVSKQAGSK